MPVTWRSIAAASLLLASLLIVATFPSLAAPPPPDNVYGTAFDAFGLRLPVGERITAWVDGADYSSLSLVYNNGSYDLDVYGNWYTNGSSPNTIEVKEGADLNDPVMFVHGDLTSAGLAFTQTIGWWPGNASLLNLHEAAVQPALLKVACVELRPPTGGQSVRVYNPGGTAVDLASYYLKKDGVGATAYEAWRQYSFGFVPANGYLTVALTGSPLNATGDDLEMVFSNNGTAFGGADLIVDRVEWNQSYGGTHYWEASNTIMTDASLNTTAVAIFRGPDLSGRPKDTNDNAADFTAGPTCFPDTAPAAPVMLPAVLSGTGLVDITLAWALSADDGSGADDVIGYEIWRGTAFDSSAVTYALLTTLPRGTATFVDSGVGLGDPTNHFYQVRALENGTGRWTAALQQAGELSRSLTELRHLLSVPLEQANWTVASVFQTVDYAWVRTYGDKPGHGHNWHSNHKNFPWNDLDTLDLYVGFWVAVATPGDWAIAGLVPTSTTIDIVVGWNFVGYPSFTPRTVGSVLLGIPHESVEGYSTAPPFYLQRLSDSDYMAATNGYWIHASAAGSTTLTN